eukprot:CAMPEP_0182561976 /NCGR_PEP_ID=MMETSP1324-20130603/4392_1 /TAXON_ID=236786 /ORGANISM="Florenciella sp., Strain RCC1587" /LENGTH=129 /DNA_ID=CAMNT_0024774775 /DNA_START=191 /DNA_END=581 /DNA_ORIENTATION=+
MKSPIVLSPISRRTPQPSFDAVAGSDHDIEMAVAEGGGTHTDNKMGLGEKNDADAPPPSYIGMGVCLVCCSIGIVCVVIPLSLFNEATGNEAVKLSNGPLLLFGLGACIISCFLVAVSGAAARIVQISP